MRKIKFEGSGFVDFIPQLVSQTSYRRSGGRIIAHLIQASQSNPFGGPVAFSRSEKVN